MEVGVAHKVGISRSSQGCYRFQVLFRGQWHQTAGGLRAVSGTTIRQPKLGTVPGLPDTLHAVLVTHAHLDHCGLLPKLVREGFRGKLYCTEATAEIVRITLMDSAHIQEEDAAFKKRRHEREGRVAPYPEIPLYTVNDAQACFPLLEPIRYRDRLALGGGMSAPFHEAGHVLGSSMVTLDIR